jgi:hypothetical protein
MAKARHANVSPGQDEPGNGYDPFSFANDMLAFQRQFFGLGAEPALGAKGARGAKGALPPASDPLEMMSTILNSCTQMLGVSALATEAMRFVTRQAQIQVEYMQALRDCRTWIELGSVNMEFTQRIAKDTSDQLRELANTTQRFLAGFEEKGHAGVRH